MPRFITGQECHGAAAELATFFDNRRDLTCDGFLLQRELDAPDLSIKLSVGQYDPEAATRTTPKPDETVVFAAGEAVCTILTTQKPLNETRPMASTALRALGSVAASLPVDIVEAGGHMLDSAMPGAPQLYIVCAVDPEGADRINDFLKNWFHVRDSEYLPLVHTEFSDHESQPVKVKLRFWPMT